MGSNSSSPTSYRTPNPTPNPTPTPTPVSLTFAEFSQQHKKKIKKVIEKFGVNQDVYINLQYFTNCPFCFSMFTTAFLPNLLQCGHFICDDCLKQEYSDKIKCAGKSKDKQCGRDIVIKKKGFIQALDSVQQEKVSACHIDQCFDVKVKDMKGKTVNLIGQPLTIKLSQLMQDHFQLAGRRNITINGKSFLYGDWSDKRLIDIGKGIIFRKISNVGNTIQIMERTDGGRTRSVENL